MMELDQQQYDSIVTAAQHKLDLLQKTNNTEWELVHTDSHHIKVYRHIAGKQELKVVKDLSSHYAALDCIQTSLTVLELREKWCPLYTNVKLVNKPTSAISIMQAHITGNNETTDMVWVEQTKRNRRSVQYIASNDVDFFMTCEVERTRATLYLQWREVDFITSAQVLHQLTRSTGVWIHPYNSHIKLQQIAHQEDGACSIVYSYQQHRLPIAAVDIHQKINRHHHHHHHHHRWHSGSWDPQDNNYTLRKNKFLTSSSLLFSNNSSPQLVPTSSIMPWMESEEAEQQQDQIRLDRDEVRLYVAYIPQLTIALPDQPEWSNKFAQLCVGCFKQQHDGYVIQLTHPSKMMQYFIDEEESMRLDDEDLESILVNISISPSSKFTVNNKEWPIREWNEDLDSNSEQEDEKENAEEEEEEEEDIFVDGMEELSHQTTPPLPVQEDIPAFISPKDILHIEPMTNHPLNKDTDTPVLQQNDNGDNSNSMSRDSSRRSSSSREEDTTVPPIHQDIDREEDIKSLELKLPATDPVSLQKAYSQFVEYLQSSSAPLVVQSPSKENGQVTIRKIDIPNHPLGGFLSESTWKDCSVWDIKAVLESMGARKVWDNTFDGDALLHELTPTSSLWHTKMKGTWPLSPRDYVLFYGKYTSAYRIDLVSTSCLGDSFQYKSLPQPVTGYTRATMDVMGWCLERLDDRTVYVKQVLVTQFPTWVIHYITSRFIVQTCAAVQSARDYLQHFGAPPNLDHLVCAQLVNVKHDHERKSWRCEYTRRMDKEADSKDQHSTPSSQTTVSVVRLDKRRWATTNSYSVIVDPPPSNVSALEKACDPYGVWLTIEHDEAFIIPLRGKILVLIKPDETASSTMECTLTVNGVSTNIQVEEKGDVVLPQRPKQASFSQNFLKDEELMAALDSNSKTSTATAAVAAAISHISEEEKINQALDKLPVSPKDHAQAALTFLKLTDEQFGWSVISDNNKSGVRISKKPGAKNVAASTPKGASSLSDSTIATAPSNISGGNTPLQSEASKHALQVFDPYVVYKGSKVIENFSVDEIQSVVTDIGNVRAAYDDTIEPQTDLIHRYGPGCKVIRQSVKALFPFKNREIYAVSCLAQEEPPLSSNTKRILYVESSLPDFPIINSKKTRGHLFMSGWILEPVDPYSTMTGNHPIPSTRVIYVAALDLGASVPSYISNLVANNWFPKKIGAVEAYLKSKGPPPYISQPFPVNVFSNNTLQSPEQQEAVQWINVSSTYDEKHQFKVTNRFKFTSQQQQQKSIRSEEVHPSPSSSTSLIPALRRQSHQSLLPEPRRGSLPTNTLTKKRGTSILSASASSPTTAAVLSRSVTCLQTTFNLQSYMKGYEIQAQLFQLKDGIPGRNISNKLVLSISEPPLSNLMNGKKDMKHTVVIKAESLSTSEEYELTFSLSLIREDLLNNRGTKLTVSHVLGEDATDTNAWKGMIMVNGIEGITNKDIKLKSISQEPSEDTPVDNEQQQKSDETSPVREAKPQAQSQSVFDEIREEEEEEERIEQEASITTMTAQYIGGGVVATALGNVSSGVNNIGARMMIPFRAASNSFLLSNSNTAPTENAADTNATDLSDEEEDYSNRKLTREEQNKIDSTSTLHEIRLLRKSSDTVRKGMFLLCICLGLAVIFALLMLQPMLERYYASFTVSSTISSLNESMEKGIVRRLMQIPWFGGWDIQVIAVRRM